MLRLTLPTESKTVPLGVPGASVTLRPVTSLDRDAAGLAAAKRVRETESAAAVLSAVLGREVDLPATIRSNGPTTADEFSSHAPRAATRVAEAGSAP